MIAPSPVAAFGMWAARTSATETAKPRPVPTNNQWKLSTLSASAASIGLSSVSMVAASWAAESALV